MTGSQYRENFATRDENPFCRAPQPDFPMGVVLISKTSG
jgi:hypothetical protein